MKTIAVLLSVIAAAVALEPCVCTLEYNPVCGSNGRTYGNLCSLKCYQRLDSSLTLAYHGECQPEPDLCICTFIYSPVCGSDGRTYGNECGLKCEQRKDSTLKLAYHGECKPVVEKRSENVCACTKEYSPVCGTDAVTYDNLCLLKCARENDASIFLLYEGACKKNQKPVGICTLEYFPICGSDGVTYGNKCQFDFTRRTKKDLYIVKYGEC